MQTALSLLLFQYQLITVKSDGNLRISLVGKIIKTNHALNITALENYKINSEDDPRIY